MVEIEKEQEWSTNWETNDEMICAWYGAEQKIDSTGKHYRAFCKVARNERSERIESAIFASRDDADFPVHRGWTPLTESEIEAREKRVEDVRSVMLPTEASPNDMHAKAHELRVEAASLFNAWLRQEELDRQATRDGEFFSQIQRAIEKASPSERAALAKMLLSDVQEQQESAPIRKSRKDHI